MYFPPEAFGTFRVLHQIGAGTLGPVFRAYEPADAADERRDRLVAIKVFRLDLTPEQSAALVTALEALIDAHINHPNIAAPIAAGLDYGAPYLAQEYAVGDSLDVVLRERGPMPVQDVAGLVDALAAAIDHAADRGVHHGLLHLRDIVLSADAVRITGFGIAGALSAIGAKLPTRPQYSSPTAASDVYAIGAIAFEAATGRQASPDSLDELAAQLGTKLRDAFDLALNADPSMRPARAQHFADRLRSATGGAGATGAMGAIGASGAMGAEAAPAGPIASPAPIAPPAPVAPIAPIAPTAPIAPATPVAPVAPDAPPVADPLDRVIDLGEPRDLEVDPPAFTTIEEPQSPPHPLNRPWSTQPSHELDAADAAEPETGRRKWPIAVAVLAVAIIAALSVGWLLRWRAAGSVTETTSGVDATIVDLPASAPAALAAGKPAPIAPAAPVAPIAPGTRPPAPDAVASRVGRGWARADRQHVDSIDAR